MTVVEKVPHGNQDGGRCLVTNVSRVTNDGFWGSIMTGNCFCYYYNNKWWPECVYVNPYRYLSVYSCIAIEWTATSVQLCTNTFIHATPLFIQVVSGMVNTGDWTVSWGAPICPVIWNSISIGPFHA